MLDTTQIDFLNAAGIAYQPAESPMLWSLLASHFESARPLGSKFDHMPESFMAALIEAGEKILLEDFTSAVREKGHVGQVTRVLEMPYVVGTEAVKPRGDVDPARILALVESPGESGERVIHVVPTQADDIPCTCQVTVEGGLYADGRTAGYFDLNPGDLVHHGRGDDDDHVHLATAEEIRALIHEMREKAENIVVVSQTDITAMIAKANQALG